MKIFTKQGNDKWCVGRNLSVAGTLPSAAQKAGWQRPPDTRLQVSGHGKGFSLLCQILNYLG